MKLSKILAWLIVLAWMMLIYQLSSQPAVQSDQISTGITRVFFDFIGRILHVHPDIGLWDHIIRKCAHFAAYCILGILAVNALYVCGLSGHKKWVIAMMICILYASSDEFHQLFVPGRGGMVADVLLDSTGSAVGIGLFYAVRKCLRRSGRFKNIGKR